MAKLFDDWVADLLRCRCFGDWSCRQRKQTHLIVKKYFFFFNGRDMRRVLHRVKFCPGAQPILHYRQIAQTIPALFSNYTNNSCTIFILRKLFHIYRHNAQITHTIHQIFIKQISQWHKPQTIPAIGTWLHVAQTIPARSTDCAKNFAQIISARTIPLCADCPKKKIEFQIFVWVFFDL